MKQTRQTEIKVGLSLLVALVILIWVVAWSKNVDFFSDKKELQISFNSVAGLEVGDQTALNGVRKGFVEKISLSGNEVLVTVVLDNDVDLRSDAEFSIMMLDLMGGKKIEIKPGTGETPLDYSKIQKGEFSGDISTAMAKLGKMEENIRIIIDELTVTLHSINNIIGDEKFTTDLKNSVISLNKLSNKVSLMLDENRKGIQTLIDSTNSLVSNSNKFLNDNSESIGKSLEQTAILLKSSSELVNRIEIFLIEIKEQKNVAGKILYDEQFYTDLKTSMENLKELTSILIDQLKNEGINVDASIDLF